MKQNVPAAADPFWLLLVIRVHVARPMSTLALSHVSQSVSLHYLVEVLEWRTPQIMR